jgi:hypothetical protein
VIEVKRLSRMRRMAETDDYSVCPLCGRDFKSDACPHTFRQVSDALNSYRGLKALGVVK